MSGYRRQRRKHGRKGWPGRKERQLASTLTAFVNWELRRQYPGLLTPGLSVTVVPR